MSMDTFLGFVEHVFCSLRVRGSRDLRREFLPVCWKRRPLQDLAIKQTKPGYNFIFIPYPTPHFSLKVSISQSTLCRITRPQLHIQLRSSTPMWRHRTPYVSRDVPPAEKQFSKHIRDTSLQQENSAMFQRRQLFLQHQNLRLAGQPQYSSLLSVEFLGKKVTGMSRSSFIGSPLAVIAINICIVLVTSEKFAIESIHVVIYA
ncbi:hypothetical protein B0J14DRAFT_10199 [Halenospora varia]|nr:hypothetical protein B0J14DRAFT_10199 [Halenospora varia]